MAQAGQELHGQDGYVLRLVELSAELLVMEASYGSTGRFPPKHLHPRQTERFEILEGSVRVIVDDEERRYRTGDTFDIPAGSVHQMAADPPARVRWEVRPALRTAEFFETLYGGAVPGDFLERFADEVRFV